MARSKKPEIVKPDRDATVVVRCLKLLTRCGVVVRKIKHTTGGAYYIKASYFGVRFTLRVASYQASTETNYGFFDFITSRPQPEQYQMLPRYLEYLAVNQKSGE